MTLIRSFDSNNWLSIKKIVIDLEFVMMITITINYSWLITDQLSTNFWVNISHDDMISVIRLNSVAIKFNWWWNWPSPEPLDGRKMAEYSGFAVSSITIWKNNKTIKKSLALLEFIPSKLVAVFKTWKLFKQLMYNKDPNHLFEQCWASCYQRWNRISSNNYWRRLEEIWFGCYS